MMQSPACDCSQLGVIGLLGSARLACPDKISFCQRMSRLAVFWVSFRFSIHYVMGMLPSWAVPVLEPSILTSRQSRRQQVAPKVSAICISWAVRWGQP